METACGFCGKQGRSKEHLWPDWIRRIILEARGHEGKRYLVEHERHGLVHQFRSGTLATRVGMPCATCNNGWMSELENAVKPFLAGMIRLGHKTLFDEERRQLLARWAVKTAMVFEFFRRDGLFYFSPEDRRSLMTSTHPPNEVWIWLAKYDATQPMHASQDRRLDNTTRVIGFYSLTLTANFFAIQIAAGRRVGPLRRITVDALPKGSLTRLWPSAVLPAELLKWPPPVTLGPSELQVLDTRFRAAGEL